MDIKPALVKELRERTGAGMMDCKKALVESSGDIELAAEHLRKVGQAKADKRSGRVAAEGQVVIKGEAGRHVIVEVNSETDFVANDANFREFAELVGDVALAQSPANLDALLEATSGGQTVEEARQALITKVGENITIRRFESLVSSSAVGTYSHMGRIGVLVEVDGADETLARDLAMHVAAASPQYVSRDEVPVEQVARERDILSAQALAEGKPANIVEKMIEGRLRKFFDEITLLGQPFVKDPDRKVADLLAAAKATVKRFVRFEVGEGIAKPTGDGD